VHDGVVEPFDGDLDEYAAWLRSRPADGEAKPAKAAAAPAAAPATRKSEAKQAPKPAQKKSGKANPQKLQQAEARVARLEGKLVECDAALSDPAVYADADRVADLGRTQMQLRAELEEAEAALLVLYEADAA
jgi:ATP-binding cassette subfamily F protein 3